ncbi:MAG: ribosome maturation factor RimM [Polyangiaceae bacterium]|nr:ribosome maturation factor RimM [Polyangiaceae bacterium]
MQLEEKQRSDATEIGEKTTGATFEGLEISCQLESGQNMNDRVKTWVPLAEIARPHGVRGEVRLSLFNAQSDTLLFQDEVLVRLPSGQEHEVSVENARRADDAILMKLFSVDDRGRAAELRGAQICVCRENFPEVEPGEFYVVDVVGAAVCLQNARIGEVVEIVTYPTMQAMLVRADDGQGDWEIPLTDAYIASVDVPLRVVTVLSLDDIERQPTKKSPAKKWKEK